MMKNILFPVLIGIFVATLGHAEERARSPLPPLAAAPSLNQEISKIAFGSCFHQERPQPLVRLVLAKQPDLFVFLGDNVYASTTDMAGMKAKYDKQAKHPDFSLLRATVPSIATWDDHDYGMNDGGREYTKKAESKELFMDFFNEPADSPRRLHPGVYASYLFGENPERRIQIILLDTRTFRTPLAKNDGLTSWRNLYHPDPNPNSTILGEEQWSWLKAQLRENAALRIIGTSIQFGHEYNGWESWTNFPSELRKMIAMIKETRANGVVFISGDVHWAELSVLKSKDCYPLHDLTASGVNMKMEKLEPNRNRFGDACMDSHFGMIVVDWSTERPNVSLQIHDITGGIRIQKIIPLNEISFETAPR